MTYLTIWGEQRQKLGQRTLDMCTLNSSKMLENLNVQGKIFFFVKCEKLYNVTSSSSLMSIQCVNYVNSSTIFFCNNHTIAYDIFTLNIISLLLNKNFKTRKDDKSPSYSTRERYDCCIRSTQQANKFYLLFCTRKKVLLRHHPQHHHHQHHNINTLTEIYVLLNSKFIVELNVKTKAKS